MLLKKIARTILLTLFVLLITGIVLVFALKNVINRKAGNYLIGKIEKAASGRYALSSDDPDISLLAGYIRFHNVSYIPTEKADTSNALYSIAAERISISGISFWQLFAHNKIDADQLSADHVLVTIHQASRRKDRQDDGRAGAVPSLAFAHVSIMDAAIQVIPSKGRGALFYSENGTVVVSKFQVDSSLINSGQSFRADVFKLTMGTFSYALGNDLYTITGKNIRSSSQSSSFGVDSVELIPHYSKKGFAKEAGYQISRIKALSENISLENFNVKAFLEWNQLIADRLKATGLSASIYRDQNIPLRKTSRPSLQKIIKDFPFRMSIDTAEITDSRVSFEQLNEGGKEPGKIFVSDMKGLIIGLDNAVTEGKKSHLLFNSTGLMFGKAKMYLYCDFPLDNETEHFFCTGSIEKMDGTLFNAYVRNTMNLLVQQGQLDSIRFSFSANEIESTGWLKMNYHDLKVGIPGKQSLKAILLKGLANGLIRNDNPDKRGKEIRGKIRFERNPYRYFPYYICRSVMSGLPSAVGIPITISDDQ